MGASTTVCTGARTGGAATPGGGMAVEDGDRGRAGGIDPGQLSTPAEFAAALTTVRLRAGRSIRDLARTTGIPSATLGGYFSGRHLPPTTQPHLLGQVLEPLGITDPAEVEQWREALIRVRRASGARHATPAATGSPSDDAPAGPSPYRGLEPFGEEDSELFFGREGIVDELVALVEGRAASPDTLRLLVVIGPSGSGKSSVLRAGLIPALRARADGPWATALLVPGSDPMAALAAARAEVAGATRSVLVVDQAEEVFSPDLDPDRRRAFVRALAETAQQQASSSTVVVVGLRADFYGQAASDPVILPALQTSQVLLGSMSIPELRRAVVRPAEAVGVSVDPELVDLLIRDLTPRGTGQSGYDAGALPLVSHALLAAWQRHRGTRLTVADYLAAGGIAGAVQQTAEDVVAGLDAPGRASAQWLFTQLVSVDDEGTMTRRRVHHDDLHHPDAATDLALDTTIEAFIAGRLLTAGDTTIEVSHEALLTAWPRLRDWVLTDLDAARLQRRIGDAAAAWRERDRDPAALLRGGPLDDAAALAARPPTSPRVLSSAEAEYVAASVAQAALEADLEHRRTRRLRALVAVMTGLALIAGLLAWTALDSRGEAQRQEQLAEQARDAAQSRQLAITADDLRERDPALAAQLALAAYRVSPTLQARSSLLDSTGVPTPVRFVGPVGEMSATASPDGDLLALSGNDGVTRLWKRADGTGAAGYTAVGELAAVAEPSSIYASAFGPDGRLLALGTANGEVIVWSLADPAAPQQVAVLGDAEASVQSVAFNRDGTQLVAGTSEPSVRRWAVDPSGATAPTALSAITDEFAGMVKAVSFGPDDVLATGSSDGTIRLWAAPTGQETALLGQASVGPPTDFVHAVAFSPDGSQLASGEKDRVARLWDVSDPTAPTQLGEPLGGFTSWVNAVAFAPDGDSLAVGSSDGSVRVFGVEDGQLRSRIPTPSAVTGTVFVGDDGLLTAEVGGVARLWPQPGPQRGGFADSIWNLLPSDDGTLVAVAPGTADGAVHLFAGEAGTPLAAAGVLTLPDGARGDGAAGMSGDGRWVAAGTATGDVAVWERDQATGATREAGVVTVSDQLVESVAISSAGTLMAAVADDGAVGVWRLAPGQDAVPAHQLSVPGLPLGAAFHPEGSLLAVGTTDGQVHLWRIGPESAEELPALTGFENYVYGITFDPTGRYLAAGSTDRTVRIWDLADPAAAQPVGEPIRGPGDTVYALSWSTDGTLAGASKDGPVWLWEIADPSAPTVRATLGAGEGGRYAVALSEGGRRVSAAGTGRTVVTWQTDLGAVADSTCARTGTGMSQAEWERLAPGTPYTPPCPVGQ